MGRSATFQFDLTRDLRPPAEVVVGEGLPALFGGLTLGCGSFAAFNLFRLSPPAVVPVVTFNCVLTLVFASLWLAVHRKAVPRGWAHPLAAGAILLTLSNVLTTFSLLGEPLQNTTVAVLLATAGFVLLSRSWLAVVLALALGAWGPVAWSVRSAAGGFAPLAMTVLLGVLMAGIVQTARLRTHGRLRSAQAALEASEKRYRRLFEQSKDIVTISTPEGRLIDMNQAGLDLFGLSSKEELEKIDLGRVYSDPGQRERLVELLLEKGHVRDHPSTIKTPSGLVELEGTTSTIQDEEGNTLFFLAIVRDVTERKRQEHELARYREDLEALVQERTHRLEKAVGQLEREIEERQRSERERRRIEAQMQHAQKLESLGVLAGGIAHDFNNLLVGILGNAELARSEIPEGSAAHEYLEQLEVATQRAGELAHQMLAYSGRGKFVLEPSDLSRLVEEMTQLLRASITKKARLELCLETDPPPIQADATQIRQVIMNLITNASDALEDRSGTIRIRVAAAEAGGIDTSQVLFGERSDGDRYVILEVEDTGCGMSEETAARIFDPFFSTKLVGRGLGMASVLGIVRSHQGWMQVRSTPGEGSRFVIGFPSIEPSLDRDRDPAVPPQAAAWRGEGTALVVDDEPGVLRVAATFLERLGFDVLVAEDGNRALELFGSRPEDIALVLLDQNMPGLDGNQICRRLRQLRPDVNVVRSSGDSLPPSGGDPGAGPEHPSVFLRKPYTFEELTRAIREALD